MSNLSEVKNIVLSLLRSCPNMKTQLTDLEKFYKQQEGENLNSVAMNFGFANSASMILSWEGFSVHGCGMQTLVECICLSKSDHISDLNKRSKKSSCNQKLRGYTNLNIRTDDRGRRYLYGPDPYAFSDNDFSDNSFDCGDDPMLQSLVAPYKIVSLRPGVITSTDKVISKPPDEIQVDDIIKIVLLDFVTPSRFWFVQHCEYRKLNDLVQSMNNFYEKEGDTVKMKPEYLREGLHVAVKFETLWHRGKILKAAAGTVRVFYVDFGSVEDVADVDDRIRLLMETFIDLPAFAQRGVLSHVQPSTSWSKDSMLDFRQMVMGQKLDARVYKKNSVDASHCLALKRRGSEPANVGRSMVLKGFCSFQEDFLTRDVNDPMGFSDYESGRWIDHLTAMKKKEDDSWLPLPLADAKPSSQPRSLTLEQKKKFEDLKMMLSAEGKKKVKGASASGSLAPSHRSYGLMVNAGKDGSEAEPLLGLSDKSTTNGSDGTSSQQSEARAKSFSAVCEKTKLSCKAGSGSENPAKAQQPLVSMSPAVAASKSDQNSSAASVGTNAMRRLTPILSGRPFKPSRFEPSVYNKKIQLPLRALQPASVPASGKSLGNKPIAQIIKPTPEATKAVPLKTAECATPSGPLEIQQKSASSCRSTPSFDESMSDESQSARCQRQTLAMKFFEEDAALQNPVAGSFFNLKSLI